MAINPITGMVEAVDITDDVREGRASDLAGTEVTVTAAYDDGWTLGVDAEAHDMEPGGPGVEVAGGTLFIVGKAQQDKSAIDRGHMTILWRPLEG